jgi:hypothetical protein
MLEQTDFIERYLAGENPFPPSVELDSVQRVPSRLRFLHLSLPASKRSQRTLEPRQADIDHHGARLRSRSRVCSRRYPRSKTLPDCRFDAVTMLTLHSHFDDIDSWLDHLLELVQPGFGPFNPNGVDVLVRLRKSGDSEWLPGWNMHSRQAFEVALETRKVRWNFRQYVPDRQWQFNNVDPLRTRVASLDNQMVLLNGAGLILSFALLEILV